MEKRSLATAVMPASASLVAARPSSHGVAEDDFPLARTSSPDLSSPAISDSELASSLGTSFLSTAAATTTKSSAVKPARLNQAAHAHNSNNSNSGLGVENSASAKSSNNKNPAGKGSGATSSTTTKRAYRKREKNTDKSTDTSSKVKTSTTKTQATASTPVIKPKRKQQKIAESPEQERKSVGSASRQPRITDLVGSDPDGLADTTARRSSLNGGPGSQRGNNEAIQLPGLASANTTIHPPPARTSGTKYDPIRSASLDMVTSDAPVRSPERPLQERPLSDARASPSIASLIDPPSTTSPKPHPLSRFMTVPSDAPPLPAPPSPSKAELPHLKETQVADVAKVTPDEEEKTGDDHARMPKQFAAVNKPSRKVSANTSSGPSPSASSPKPARQKDNLPPVPSGSGLLSSALFGGPTSVPMDDANGCRPPTIVIDVPINSDSDRYVNFARLAEQRFDFNALHPRLAAQQERLARVAAAGEVLERASGANSADDMSLDLSEPESNVEMGGTEGSGDGAEKAKPTRKRKAKADEYDKDDPFVDDSELLWQEQAAASKDGFFIYSGPLVREGEKLTIERWVLGSRQLYYIY